MERAGDVGRRDQDGEGLGAGTGVGAGDGICEGLGDGGYEGTGEGRGVGNVVGVAVGVDVGAGVGTTLALEGSGGARSASRGGAPRENTQRPPAQHFAFALGGRAPPGEKEA